MQALINGNEIFYTIHGQGRPMLLMHGGSGLDHTYFRPWLDSLGDRVELIDHQSVERAEGRAHGRPGIRDRGAVRIDAADRCDCAHDESASVDRELSALVIEV